MKKSLIAPLSIAALLAVVANTNAATVHFTASGVQALGNAELWGAANITMNSTAFEVRFDFTATTDAITQAIPLLEGGGNGLGTSVVLDNDNIHFWARNNVGFVFTAAHGLSAPQDDVQIVATITYDTSGNLDTYEIFVNGASIGTKSDLNMNNDWAGGDGGTGLGQEGGTQRYDGTTLFDSGNMAIFTDGDDDDITVNIYDQTLPDYDLNDILIDGPSAPSELRIIEISLPAGSDEVSLTWTSQPTEKYAVKYSLDMIDWSGGLKDEIAADAGKTTTGIFDLGEADLEDEPRVFFRVEIQSAG